MILDRSAFDCVLGDEAGWAKEYIPFFECPHREIQEIYYYRWAVYKRNIKPTPDGFIISEFQPDVPWAGKHNSISCAAGHHIYEGRWLWNEQWLDDYSVFWFRKGGEPRRYSFWAADAMYARYQVTQNAALTTDLLDDLASNFKAYEADSRDPNGLFWQIDDRDGMEVSIGGSGHRPTINSYMFGEATAISRIAELAGRGDMAAEYRAKAAEIKRLVQEKLWDRQGQFFKTLPRNSDALVDVREEVGFIPWYFNLPDSGYEVAWKQLMDGEGFFAPFGPTTAERRHPRFMFHNDHDCLWNGPSWPYATTQTLVAMANLLNNYRQDVVSAADYLTILAIYARSQYKDGHPWIAEDLNALTGQWIVDKPRSIHYNHSGYCDLIITGLAGLRPRADRTVEINPLAPAGWEYFCLENVPYHKRSLTIIYDKTGRRYGKGAGLAIYVDGKEIARRSELGKLTAALA